MELQTMREKTQQQKGEREHQCFIRDASGYCNHLFLYMIEQISHHVLVCCWGNHVHAEEPRVIVACA